tara:strand:+ start:3850 stop:4158 length:309 start_codon:yes stop_codon:yes gene_type:complete
MTWKCKDKDGKWMSEKSQWSVDCEKPKGGVSSSVPIMDGNKTIALILWEGWSDGEGEANAHKIAAAPEMLEALENLENDNGKAMPPSAWKLVQDAISKARGE